MGVSLSTKSGFRLVQSIPLTLMDCNRDGKQGNLVLLMPKFRNMFSHHIYLLLQFDHASETTHWDPTTVSQMLISHTQRPNPIFEPPRSMR